MRKLDGSGAEGGGAGIGHLVVGLGGEGKSGEIDQLALSEQRGGVGEGSAEASGGEGALPY